jgi:cell division ATPase FtsA
MVSSAVVVNIDATVQSIQQALKEAELMADCKIQRVYTGITGSHIRGLNSSGMVAVKDKEVTRPTWRAWWRPPRPSTSAATSACCWWSRRSS